MEHQQRHRLRPVLAAALIVFCVGAAAAQPPAQDKHPYYPKALVELRLARALVQPAQGEEVLPLETEALGRIDGAIGELERVIGSQGSGRDERPAPAANLRRPDRYYRAIKHLAACQGDALKETEDPAFPGLRLRTAVAAGSARQMMSHAIEQQWRPPSDGAPEPTASRE